MTVCAAAICTLSRTLGETQYAILAISDRMLTLRDTEYEPKNTTKIYRFDSARVIALGAGRSDINYAVSMTTRGEVITGKTSSINVSQIAKRYADNLWTYRQDYLERMYLSPIGLTTKTFPLEQKKLLPSLAMEIVDHLWNDDLETESLICGIDEDGPHIYRTTSFGEVFCFDKDAFAAIGSGANQFETLFMASGYDTTWSLQDALFLIYSAKKKAEAVSGVGKLTDLFFISRQDFPQKALMLETKGNKTFDLVSVSAMEALEERYQKLEMGILRERQKAVAQAENDDKIFYRTT